MFAENFVLSLEKGKKMSELGLPNTTYAWIMDSNGDWKVLTPEKDCKNYFGIAVAPTLGEIPLSENGWKIFNAMRGISEISEIELRAWVWITERVLAQKEVQNA